MSAKDDKLKQLANQVDALTAEVAKLKKLDLDDILSSSTSRRTRSSDGPKKPKHEKPDWVQAWNKQNASHGEVRTLVKTTDTYNETEGFDSRTEIVDPVLTTKHSRNLETGEVEEIVIEAGLPEHLKLGVLHEDRPSPSSWTTRPTHDGLLDKSLPLREGLKKLQENPGNPLELRDEGPTKPVRKQMVRFNKVWKYRNFKKCENCGEFDTWEARVDPYKLENVGVVHAEIWCHTCGSTDFEVSEHMPAHIGSWAPAKETPKQMERTAKARVYREERSVASLKESPKTVGELYQWFLKVEGYTAVDFIMIEIVLKRLQRQGRVVLKDGKWVAV